MIFANIYSTRLYLSVNISFLKSKPFACIETEILKKVIFDN